MVRLARVVVPGVAHHVTQRGSRQQETFSDEEDNATYPALLSKWCHAPAEAASQNDARKKYDVRGIKADQAISLGQEPLFTWLHTCFGQG
jgi:hypothetical protein